MLRQLSLDLLEAPNFPKINFEIFKVVRVPAKTEEGTVVHQGWDSSHDVGEHSLEQVTYTATNFPVRIHAGLDWPS